MFGGRLRVLEIYGEPADLGRGHGAECAALIRDYLQDRIGLSGQQRWSGTTAERDFILETAEETLSHHELYSPGLYAEMLAMADAAGITPAEAVVVGGFTDLVDVVRSRAGAAPAEDNCTGIINPEMGFLAQTWDMHASAGEFVVMLKLDPVTGPALVVQTTAGCLGQMGINEAGIAIGINNLTAMGKPGVTWPFVVRKVLEQSSLDAAVKVVLDADLAGGHNFMIMGPDGVGANIEAMPNESKVTRVGREPFVHTNHCLNAWTAAEEGTRLPESVASSDSRLEVGRELASDLDSFFADPTISRRVDDTGAARHEVATCGAVVMEPGERRMRSVWGIPGDHPWETFQL